MLVTDAPLTGATTLDALGESALVVDGWTEDWYFPNLGNMDALKYGVLSVAVGRQIVVRYKTKNAQVAAQANVRMMPNSRLSQNIVGLPPFRAQ